MFFSGTFPLLQAAGSCQPVVPWSPDPVSSDPNPLGPGLQERVGDEARVRGEETWCSLVLALALWFPKSKDVSDKDDVQAPDPTL